jgi:peptide/nickel transport system permease protein
MKSYFLKRVLLSVLIIWGVLTLTFILIHIAPGDPSLIYIDPEIDPAVVNQIRQQMGLNQPLHLQYYKWLEQFISGNFGMSFMHKRPVSEVLAEAIPNTLQLTIAVFALQILIGTIVGIYSALKRYTQKDFLISSFTIFLYSIPGFWLALMVILIFSLKLGWLPSSHMQSIHIGSEFWEVFADRIEHLILPVMVLGLPLSAHTSRFVRGSFIDVLTREYIRTPYAYGINKRKIFFKYALKNSLLPLITLVGMYLPFILGGAVITEYIFSWPGMGRITVEAIFAYDYPIILASTAIAAAAVVIGNFLSDILYKMIDPRINYSNI